MRRVELVADRRAGPVGLVRIDDLPVAHRRGLGASPRLALALENRLLLIEGIAVGIGWAERLGVGVALDKAVAIAIHGHIEARAENVLVNVPDEAGRNFASILAGLPRNAGRRVDDARRLHL